MRKQRWYDVIRCAESRQLLGRRARFAHCSNTAEGERADAARIAQKLVEVWGASQLLVKRLVFGVAEYFARNEARFEVMRDRTPSGVAKRVEHPKKSER